MKIIQEDNFSIYIYKNDHPPPHCHVILSDETEIVIKLPAIKPMYSKKITRKIKEVVYQNLELLCKEWDKSNPIKEE